MKSLADSLRELRVSLKASMDRLESLEVELEEETERRNTKENQFLVRNENLKQENEILKRNVKDLEEQIHNLWKDKKEGL